MSDQSLKRALIILGAIIVLIIIIFAIIIGSKNKSAKKELDYYDRERTQKIGAIETGKISGRYESKLYNEEYINLTQEERTEIDDIVDNVLSIINNKDVDAIWEYLEPRYRSCLFPEKKYLERYLNKYYPASKTYKSFGYEIDEESLYITIGADVSGDNMEEYIKIDNFKDENRKMYFGYYIYFEDINLLSEVDDVILSSYSILHYKDSVSVVFRIRNKTNKDAKVSFSNCIAYVQNARTFQEYPLLEDVEFDIAANDMEICEVKFKGFSKAIQKMDLSMLVNDQAYKSKTVYVTYEGV